MTDTVWENKYIPWAQAGIGGRYFDKYTFTAEQMREAIRRAVEDKLREYEAANITQQAATGYGAGIVGGKGVKYEELLKKQLKDAATYMLNEKFNLLEAMSDPSYKAIKSGYTVNIRKPQQSHVSCQLVKDENGFPHSFGDTQWGGSLP